MPIVGKVGWYMRVELTGAGTGTMRLTPAFGICTEPKGIPVWATVPPVMFVVRVVDSAVLVRLDAQVDVLPIDDGVTPGDIPPPSNVLRPEVLDCVVLIPDKPMD
jgi:hypothetical protein